MGQSLRMVKALGSVVKLFFEGTLFAGCLWKLFGYKKTALISCAYKAVYLEFS